MLADADRETKQVATGNLIVLTGPSGVGKGTIVAQLFERMPDLRRSVSMTTGPSVQARSRDILTFLSSAPFSSPRSNRANYWNGQSLPGIFMVLPKNT